MTFYYKNVELQCPDFISKKLSEHLNYYSISSRDFFETLEKIGFIFPIQFIDFRQNGTHSSVLISSADDSMSYRIKLDCINSGKRAITLIDEFAYEECSYQLSTAKPLKYVFSIPGGTRSVEFEYSDPRIVFKLDLISPFSIKFKDDFNNFQFNASFSEVNLSNFPIPNLLVQNDKFSQVDENYSSIVEYLLNLEPNSDFKEIYRKLYEFYSAKSCTLEFKGTENHLTFPNFVYNKIAVNNGKLIEVAEYQSCYNGTVHMFDNGDWSFETPNHSIRLDKSKGIYIFTGEWNDVEINSIKNITNFFNKYEAEYYKFENFIKDIYAKENQ